MENTSIPSNICNFNSIECNGIIRSITHNTKIPKSTESIISVGMYLCQIHYNRFSLNEIRNINYNKSCEHPKHDEYKNQSKNTKKKSKKLILEKVPKRLIEVLGLNESSEICSMCKYRTDKDPEYLQDKNYKAPIPIKINNLDDNNNLQNESIEAIQNESTEVIQDESIEVIQDESIEFIQNESIETKQIITCQHPKHDEYLNQSKNTNETKLSNKIIKMSNILYYNQHRLNLKPIYDPIAFKTMLEKADKDLIGFFDELYAGTNPNTKSYQTNENNKKKLVSLCYFLASINNKYINDIKVDIGSYLQTSGTSSSSIDTLANIGVSVTRKTVNSKKNLISD